MKLGKFIVHDDFIHGLKRGEGLNLFVGMGVIGAERDFMRRICTYTAYHEQFEECPQAMEIPMYRATFPDDESVNPVWVKVTEISWRVPVEETYGTKVEPETVFIAPAFSKEDEDLIATCLRATKDILKGFRK